VGGVCGLAGAAGAGSGTGVADGAFAGGGAGVTGALEHAASASAALINALRTIVRSVRDMGKGSKQSE